MILDLSMFKEAILILKTNTFSNIIDSLESLRGHYELTLDQWEGEMHELRHISVHYKKYQNQVGYRIRAIEGIQIFPWVPLLKKHQETSVYPNVKSTTVANIMDAKKQIDGIQLSLDEFKIRLFEQARKAKKASNTVKMVEKQIFILESAADIAGFFNMNNYTASDIADFEIEKYYELYKKGGSING